jgi:hypothetical protein
VGLYNLFVKLNAESRTLGNGDITVLVYLKWLTY